MIQYQTIVVIIFLVILSIIDYKTYNKRNAGIPATLTTSFLIAMIIFGGEQIILPGILAAAIAILLTDLEFWGGIADFKAFVATSIFFKTLPNVAIFAMLTTAVAVLYKIFALKVIKKESALIPFIPTFLVAFLLALVII